MVFIDYLQLIGKDHPRQSDYEIVTAASKAMKGLARELNCPVVSAAQFNRKSEDGEKPESQGSVTSGIQALLSRMPMLSLESTASSLALKALQMKVGFAY